MLQARERLPGSCPLPGINKQALRMLIKLLGDRPEQGVVLVLDLAHSVLAELRAGVLEYTW